MNNDRDTIFESLLDDLSTAAADVTAVTGSAADDYPPYPHDTEMDCERADWDDDIPLTVGLELMLFRDNRTFTEYFDLLTEIMTQQRFVHRDVRATTLKDNEWMLVRPDTGERIVRATFFMPIRPSLRQFLDFMTVIAGVTIRANSRNGLTPTVDVYQKWEGRDAREKVPYMTETGSGPWQELCGFLYNYRLERKPWKGGKKRLEEKIEQFSQLLMKHEWFYNKLGYDQPRMEREVGEYFDRLFVRTRVNK